MVGKVVFVTVGTTKFDLLVHTITTEEILNLLRQKGYTSLIIQLGDGSILPNEINSEKFNIKLSFYKYKNSIHEDILKADLVISHAGAGSIFEVLKEKKPLIVVVNEELMHNHQTELANQLSSDGYLFSCSCATLSRSIKNIGLTELKIMPPVNPKLFANHLDSFMGFVS